MKTKKRNYVIFRIGSNAANQGGTYSQGVDLIEAASAKEAVEIAYKNSEKGQYTIYSNQHLEAKVKSAVSKNEYEAVAEDYSLAHELISKKEKEIGCCSS